jgi:hypothetical protein
VTDGDYPKRLIEVDLPIARIAAHARWESAVLQGPILKSHTWWMRILLLVFAARLEPKASNLISRTDALWRFHR